VLAPATVEVMEVMEVVEVWRSALVAVMV